MCAAAFMIALQLRDITASHRDFLSAPMMPPRGEARACTSALLSVRKPSCLGVASKEAATQMYTAARGTAMCLTCSQGDIAACIRCCHLLWQLAYLMHGLEVMGYHGPSKVTTL